MKFGAVYRLKDTVGTDEFIVMVVRPALLGGSPTSVILLNTVRGAPDDYLPGMVSDWSVQYDDDWERIDDHS